MSAVTHLIYSPAAVRELDRRAIEDYGIPGYTLMTRAGQATFDLARKAFPEAGSWLVLCGAGNNAGDGYVIARIAQSAGLNVTVSALSDPECLVGDALAAWTDFKAGGGEITEFTDDRCSESELIIDALLGTGLDRALEGQYKRVVDAVNTVDTPVLAVDIPTGLNGLTGAVMGTAIRANMTATFVAGKQGMFLGSGADCCGKIVLDDLGIPAEVTQGIEATMRRFTTVDLAGLLPQRAASAHKGNFGHVLVVGGNHSMGGAVRLAGAAALRSGAGLVTVGTCAGNMPAIIAGRPELMCCGIDNAAALEPLLERASVVALGPGLGKDAWAQSMYAKVLASQLPKVLDADALNLLAAAPVCSDDWILTPHPGEAARLLGVTTGQIQSDRLNALSSLVDAYGGVVVLKGRGTLIGCSGMVPFLIDGGNPGMSTAGMGDVLTGVTAGLVAQLGSSELHNSAVAAAHVHASAGDLAARSGQRGLIATDVLDCLRSCLNPN